MLRKSKMSARESSKLKFASEENNLMKEFVMFAEPDTPEIG